MTMTMRSCRAAVLAVCVTLVPIAATAQIRPAPSYGRDVVPILRTACIGCHGAQNGASGLDVTSFAMLMKGGKGGPSILAGKSGDSKLVKMLLGTVQPKMPPGGGMKQADIDKIRAWIDAGAKQDFALPVPTAAPKRGPSRAVRPVFGPNAARAAKASTKMASPINSLAFSPDGAQLAVGTFREVQLWETTTWTLKQKWSGHAGTVQALAYSKDGLKLAAGGGNGGETGEVRIWSVKAGKEEASLIEHGDTVNGVAFSPEGAKLASGSADKSVKIWDLATGKSVLTLREHSDAVWGVAWSPDGKTIASASADKSAKVWDAATGKRLYSIGGHTDVVYSVEYSPDGKRLVTAGADKRGKVWTFGMDGSNGAFDLNGHDGSVQAATFGPNSSRLATASADKQVKLWNDGNATATLKEAADWVYSVRFKPDGTQVAAGDWSGDVMIWDTASGKLVARLHSLGGTSEAPPLPPKEPAKKG